MHVEKTTTQLRKLRPAKVRNASQRRWFERQLARTRLREAPGLIDLGSAYGGWTIPGELIEPTWVCYSVGAGGDISFDLELIKRYGVTVRSFDAVDEYVQEAIRDAAEEPRFSARHAAVAIHDGPLRMQVTHDPTSHSVSPAGLYETDRFIEVPGRSLMTLMADAGDERIDFLKLDVEGGEYSLLPKLDLRALGVKLFSVQLHHTGTVQEANALIDHLAGAGYDAVAIRPVIKVTFVARELLEGATHSS